ncbi:MAG TPA: hypothetical protein PL045_08135 [Chitinophagaceae bacterium]|nr:hypothetical protein [Chitinophagaceae bacterium]
MNQLLKISLISFGLNVVSLLLLYIEVGFLIILLSLFVQFILGIVYALSSNKKKIGQGMLIGLGIFILVGFSICTIAVFTAGWNYS